jgi:hypothetical protein
MAFVMWQLSPATLAMYFDVDPPTPEADGSLDFDIRTDEPQHLYSVGVDARDGGMIFRLGFYRASLSAAGDMQIQRGGPIPLDVTLSALDDGGRLANVKLGGGGIEQAAAWSLEDIQRMARGGAADMSSGARRARATAGAASSSGAGE